MTDKTLDLTPNRNNFWTSTLIEALQKVPAGHIITMYGGNYGAAFLVASKPDKTEHTLIAMSE